MDATSDLLEQAIILAKQARAFAKHLSTIRGTHKRKHGNMYSITRRAFHRALRREHLVVQMKAAIEQEFIDKNFGHLTPGERLEIICSLHPISPQERERQKQGAQRLKERLSSLPHHQKHSAADPEGEDAYWLRLYQSCINA